MTSNSKRSTKAKIHYPTGGNGYNWDLGTLAFGIREKKNYVKEGEKKNA
jgi:hypothetical protein